MIRYLKCPHCGYEDSSILTLKYDNMSIPMIECPECKILDVFQECYCEKGKNMTLEEYQELVKYIYLNFGWRKSMGKNFSKRIKYIRCTFDTRTGEIFHVSLDHKDFTIVNENRHRNLKEWIYEYLNKNAN